MDATCVLPSYRTGATDALFSCPKNTAYEVPSCLTDPMGWTELPTYPTDVSEAFSGSPKDTTGTGRAVEDLLPGQPGGEQISKTHARSWQGEGVNAFGVAVPWARR